MTAMLDRLAHCHGDESLSDLSAEQQALIDLRAGQIISERLADANLFADLMSGIEPTSYYPLLQRIVLNVAAPRFNQTSVEAITTAAHQLERLIRCEAMGAWKDEAEALAEREILEMAA